jgi:hypothetical protein
MAAIRAALAVALRIVAGVLFAFHLVLFSVDAADGRLLDPAVAARWSVAVLLFAALIALWRLGVPLLRSRRAAVIWLLVLFLHGSAHAPGLTNEGTESTDPSGGIVLIILPVVATGLVALTLVLVGLSREWRSGSATLLPLLKRVTRAVPPAARGFTLVLAERPPPVA